MSKGSTKLSRHHFNQNKLRSHHISISLMEVDVYLVTSFLTDCPKIPSVIIFLLQVVDLRLREGPAANEGYQWKQDSELCILCCFLTK